MAMAVMGVWNMRVRMALRRMPMRMAVFTGRKNRVHILMMPIVMAVRVLMLQDFVLVLVAMRLGQVQHHAGQHQAAAQRHQAAS